MFLGKYIMEQFSLYSLQSLLPASVIHLGNFGVTAMVFYAFFGINIQV